MATVSASRPNIVLLSLSFSSICLAILLNKYDFTELLKFHTWWGTLHFITEGCFITQSCRNLVQTVTTFSSNMSVYDYLIPHNVTTKQITEAPELKAFQARDTSKLRTKFLFLSQYVSSIIAFYKLQWGGLEPWRAFCWARDGGTPWTGHFRTCLFLDCGRKPGWSRDAILKKRHREREQKLIFFFLLNQVQKRKTSNSER